MKYLFFVMIFASTLTLNAREATQADANLLSGQSNNMCPQYNLTAINSIYDLALNNQKLLENNHLGDIACQAKFDKFLQNTDETTLSAQQIDQLNDQCHKELGLLNEEQKTAALRTYNQLGYVRIYKNKQNFIQAHTTNLSMSCEVAYDNISKLKSLLNL